MSYQKLLRTFLTKTSVILFLTMNIGIAQTEQEKIETEQAAALHVQNMIYAPIARNAAHHLSKKGLADTEIDDAIDEITNKFADCIVSSLKKANNEEIKYAIELIATDASSEEISSFFDSLQNEGSADALEVFDKESDVCISSVDASYGLLD